MTSETKWLLTDAEKGNFIATLTPYLAILRTQAEISQEELSNLIGISRQTYSAIERKVRRMSWNTYLSLILFYDHNQKTHKLMRHLSLFPTELVIRFNAGVNFSSFELSQFLGEKAQDIIENLDEQAQQIIRKTIISEHTRCIESSNRTPVKGTPKVPVTDCNIQAPNAIRAIIADTDYCEQ